MALLDNLEGYWKLDDSSNDSLNISNGTDTSVSYVSGKINNAAEFNASGDNIDLGNAAGLQITTNLTIAFWYKSSATNNASGRPWGLVMKNNDSSARAYGCYQDTGTGGISFVFFSAADGSTGKIVTKEVPDTNWNHWAVTFNPTTEDTVVYLNGSSVGYTTALDTFTGGLIANPTVNLTFGNRSGTANWGAVGTLDEIGIWNDILTADNITELYNSGSGLSYPFGAISGGTLPMMGV